MGTVWDDERQNRQRAWGEAGQLRDYLRTLSPVARAQYLANQRQLNQTPANVPHAPQNAQQAPGGPIAQGGPPMALSPIQAAYLEQGPHAQAAALRGAIDKTEDAIRDENDSRVSQAREAKRMEFARDMERMRQEALLQRLAMEQQQQASYAPPPSGNMRVFNPNTLSWDYTDSVTFGG